MTTYLEDFPYEEIRDDGTPEGDFFASYDEALSWGYNPLQIWAITEELVGFTFEARISHFTYGPGDDASGAYGWLATIEHHDGDTYFVEVVEFPRTLNEVLTEIIDASEA